jgi:hypothetical protein
MITHAHVRNPRITSAGSYERRCGFSDGFSAGGGAVGGAEGGAAGLGAGFGGDGFGTACRVPFVAAGSTSPVTTGRATAARATGATVMVTRSSRMP